MCSNRSDFTALFTEKFCAAELTFGLEEPGQGLGWCWWGALSLTKTKTVLRGGYFPFTKISNRSTMFLMIFRKSYILPNKHNIVKVASTSDLHLPENILTNIKHGQFSNIINIFIVSPID